MANLVGVLMRKPPAQQSAEAPTDEDQRFVVTLGQPLQPMGKTVEYLVGEPVIATKTPSVDVKTSLAQVTTHSLCHAVGRPEPRQHENGSRSGFSQRSTSCMRRRVTSPGLPEHDSVAPSAARGEHHV